MVCLVYLSEKMASVRVLCNYMLEKGVINYNPFSEIKNSEYATKVTLPKSPPLANSDEEKLLKYIDEQIDSGNISKIKELSIFLLIYEKCLRVEEIINLKRQDVIIDSNGTVFLNIHKYGVPKRVVTVEYYTRTAVFMKLYLSMINIREDDFIFLNARAHNANKLYDEQAVRRLIRRHMKAAGINEKVVIMNIRATSIRNQSQKCSLSKLSAECGITHHTTADWIYADRANWKKYVDKDRLIRVAKEII